MRKRPEPSKVVLRCAELWNEHKLSGDAILDKIMDETGIALGSNAVYAYRQNHPELFEQRDPKISTEIRGHTFSMNKMLRSSRRVHVEKELAKLDAKRVKTATKS